MPEKISPYTTGSAFTQHSYVCRVLFFRNCFIVLPVSKGYNPKLYTFLEKELIEAHRAEISSFSKTCTNFIFFPLHHKVI